MRSLVTWLLDGLPFDPRSRRALDETLLDWAAEEAEAGAGAARWSVQLSGLLAIVRTLVSSTTREVTWVPIWWLLKRTAFFCVLPAALLSVPMMFPLVGTVGYSRLAVMLALVTPGSLVVTVPLGLLLGLMWRSRAVRMPPAATALIVAGAMLVFQRWGLPLTNDLFINLYTPALVQALPGLTREVVAEVYEAHWIDVTWIHIWGFATLAGASVLLAESLFRRIALRRLKWIAAVPTAYLVTGGIVSSIAARVMPNDMAAAAGLWAQAATVMLAAVVIQRRTTRESRAIGS